MNESADGEVKLARLVHTLEAGSSVCVFYFCNDNKKEEMEEKRDITVVEECAGVFSIQGGRLLPRIPTAKYPKRAMMKRMQQRTSVQPLCTAEAKCDQMFQEA